MTRSGFAFEIVVVDGMSSDGTRAILERLAKEELGMKVIDNPHLYKSFALNIGIKAARGQYIAIMDAHNVYSPDYIERCMQIMEGRRVDAVGGCWNALADSYIQTAIAVAHHSLFATGGARCRDHNYDGLSDTVFGGFYRRETFDKVGLFDEELVRNQDDEFNLRINRAGGTIWQSSSIKSWYTPRHHLSDLFRQYLQYGYWKVRVIQKHKIPASPRHLVPGGFVFILLALPSLVLWWPFAAQIWLTLIGTYCLALLVVAAATARRHGWRVFPALPLVFACYHFGYGLGFLSGVAHFIVLRRGPTSTWTRLTRPRSST